MEGDKPTDHGIVFVINEGAAQKIWKVEFVGNEFISSRRLKTKIESKPPLLYLFKGYVDREQIDGDVNRLTAFYRSFGYFQAVVGRQLKYDDNNKWMTLQFVISEGPRYQVESVAFIGNRIFSNESLASGIQLKPDSTDGPQLEQAYHKVFPLPPGARPFEQDKMNADVAWLKELYGSQGYVFADIKAEPIFLEERGKLKLLYHIEEGRRWRIGNIYVHINGDNPHTKIQTALNRLSFRSGDIADVREFKNSERRLQSSGLFMHDPIHGVTPKITYHIPEVGGTEMAKGSPGPGFRGQSPDGNAPRTGGLLGGVQLLPAQGLPEVAGNTNAGPPLIAPPNSPPVVAQIQSHQTFKVQPPTNAAPANDQVELHLYLDTEAPRTESEQDPEQELMSWNPPPQHEPAAAPAAAEVAPADALPPGAQRYEVRRYPYDNLNAPTSQETPVAQPASSTAPPSVYRKIVIRTQSPYQQPITPITDTPQSADPYSANQSAPTVTTPNPASRYAGATYGGQSIGATGPDAAPVGSNPYSVRQAAITEPQLPPGGPSPAVAPPPAVGPTFGPPPIEQLPAPPYAPPGQPAPGPPPVYGPAPIYGPPPMGPGGPMVPGQLAPDPRITPVTPAPTTPYPTDSFTPMTLDPPVDLDVVLSEAQTGRLMLGVAVNSDAGLVGQILLDEQNFDISRPPTSFQDFIDGRGWRGGGQRLRIEAAPGTEVQRYLISFTEPYVFNSPYSLGLSGSYFTRQYRDWDEQRVGGRASIGYQWVENDLSTAIAYRGEDVLVTNVTPGVPELAEMEGHNAVHGFKWTVANDTRDSAFLATEGHFLQLELEQVVGSFQYPRAIFDARQYFLLSQRPDYSGRHVLTLSTKLGFSGDDTPVYDRFFAGGFSTLRGFDFRGASPVSNPNIPAAVHAQIGGDFEFINTVEYLFPLTADDMIHGVAFVDFGTVNENVALNNFRVAPGLGLRITVPAMGPAPIALDFAFPVAKADFDDTQVFSFNIGLQR
jgi:outer membrane protein insertion porin family